MDLYSLDIRRRIIIGKLFIKFLHYFLYLLREFIIFFRKIFPILIIVYLDQLLTVQKSLFLIIVYLFVILMQFSLNPFLTKQLNFLEINQILTIILSIILGTISHLLDNTESKLFLAIILIILNTQFIVLSIKMIILIKLYNLNNLKISKSFWFFPLKRLARLAGFFNKKNIFRKIIIFKKNQ